jgi:AraC-like DNA-binding protein
MKIKENGVQASSEVYFHTASETAKSLFFYIRCTGRYQCDGDYAVQRQRYNSFLLLFVVSGSGYLTLDGRKTPISEGTLALLDCYQPHSYGTDTGWDILWVHFDGEQARAYYNTIVESHSQYLLMPDPYRVMRSMEKIFRMYHHEKCASEAMINQYIVTVLTELLVSVPERVNDGIGGNMEESLTFITQNLDRPLTLNELAKRAALSPFYFSRVFKRETGYTPHDYLVHARVNAAKFYLKTTQHSNKEISYRCGFSSESSFCTVFKRVTGITPQTYKVSNCV